MEDNFILIFYILFEIKKNDIGMSIYFPSTVLISKFYIENIRMFILTIVSVLKKIKKI